MVRVDANFPLGVPGNIGPTRTNEDVAGAETLIERQHEGYNPEDSSSDSADHEKGDAEKHVFQVPADFAETLLEYDPFTYNSILDEYMEVILTHLDDRSVEEWLQILKKFNDYHDKDNLIPLHHFQFLRSLENGPSEGMSQADWELLVKFEAFLYYEWSVYPDVRAVTVPIDEEDDEDYETFRVYIIGCLWGMAGCVLDTFFSPRFPAITIGTGAIQLLIALNGKAWALLPYIAIPYWKGKKFVINNGRRWTFREQMLASLTMSVSIGSPYVQNVVLALSNENFFQVSEADDFGFIILLIWTTAFMGFSVAGLQRAFFVYPTKMVFFDSLNINDLNRAFVKKEIRENVNGWILTRNEFFWLFTFIWFGWYWVTNLAFGALSQFNWTAWIAPHNTNLQAITGMDSGLGFYPVATFDTNVITFTSLYTPFNALWQWHCGYFISMIAIIIIWYTNVANTAYLPINSNTLFDNTGAEYNTSQILNSKYQVDLEKYQNYSLPFYTAGNLVNYGSAFMFFPACFVGSFLYYWRDFYQSFSAFSMMFKFRSTNKVLDQFDDRFSRVVRQHPEAPEWWFALIFCCSFGVSVAVVEHWGFVQTPVYSIAVSCAIALVFVLPQNALRARTAYFFEVDQLISLIMGLILEGNPFGMMVSRIYAYSFASQSDNYVDNQKIGHYSGIAPRPLFRCQIVSVIVCSLVQAGILKWQASGALGHDFCSLAAQQTSKFTCQTTRTTFNAAIVWGAISPKRIFKGVYPHLKWTFLIGALYPLPLFFCRQLFPLIRSKTRPGSFWYRFFNADYVWYIDDIVWLNAGQYWAPQNWYYWSSNLCIGIFWHKWLRPKYPQWWAKYTYLFYNTTTVANAFAALFNFFATEYKHIYTVDWWGNDVMNNTDDANGVAVRLPIPERGYFGPAHGQFPK